VHSIQETASETGLSAHTLRYYERIGLLRPIERSESGYRLYSDNDIGWLRFLICLAQMMIVVVCSSIISKMSWRVLIY